MFRKSLIICAAQIANALFLEKLKHFEVMLNIFEFSLVLGNVEPWLVYPNKLFWIAQPTELPKSTSTGMMKQS